MTWKEFKDQVEDFGITDDMKVEFIDVNCGFSVDSLKKIFIAGDFDRNEFSVVGNGD
jgi:hypothetical protein